jgi:hypothetical protein
MSRNLCQRNCYFCPGDIKLLEAPRPITKEDCGVYFKEYDGMLVAHAHCVACLAKYTAWVTGPAGSNWNSVPREEGQTHVDLSFRSTFDDEPGEDDLPRYKVVTKLIRERAFTESDSNYFRLGEVKSNAKV